jgi:hypothetical protein
VIAAKRDHLDRIDLDLTRTDAIAPTRLDRGLLPQPDRERDVAGHDVAVQFAAELHDRDATSLLGHGIVRYVASAHIG